MPDYMLKGPNDQSFKLSVPEGTSEADIGQHISTFADRLSASGEPENIEDRRGESISLTDEFKNAWNNNWRDQKEGWRRLGIDFDAIGLPRSRPHYSRDPE